MALLMEGNIVNQFYNQAILHPKQLAIVSKKRSITYFELSNQVQQTAASYHKKGIRKGDKVLVFVPMSIELYRIILALFHLGAIPVFLDEWSSVRRLNEAAETAKCKALIATWKGQILAWFIKGLRSIKLKIMPSESNNNYVNVDIAAVFKDDPVLITFSTGSTGKPKAAIRTYSMLQNQFEALKIYIDLNIQNSDMTSLPIVLMINLGLGKTSIIPDSNLRNLESMNSKSVHQQMMEHKISSLSCSPYFAERYANYLVDTNQKSSLQRIIMGGAPCYPKIVEIIKLALPDAIIRIVYGSTEAEPISSILAEELLDYYNLYEFQGLAVGSIHHYTNVKIIPVLDHELHKLNEIELENLELKQNSIGEIIVKGPHVLRNYLDNEIAEKQNKIFTEKSVWHRTGDSGYLDENNRLFLTGRCKQLIHCEGKLISPFVFEEKLGRISSVELGTILENDGEIICVIQSKPGSDNKRIEQEIMTKFSIISRVKFMTHIPRDPRHHSKIDYVRLKELI